MTSDERQQFIDDKLSSMLAMTHALQNRILNAQRRGYISPDTARQMAANSKQIGMDAHAISMLPKA